VEVFGNRYSNELANGDSADDKENQTEMDGEDDIVDFNGQTNRGYAHHVPRVAKAHNTITDLFPDHFGTEPREDFVQIRGDGDLYS